MGKIIIFLTALSLSVFLGFLLSYPVMLLWNGCLVGAVNGVNKIEWLQAWGILVLFGVLFKKGDHGAKD